MQVPETDPDCKCGIFIYKKILPKWDKRMYWKIIGTESKNGTSVIGYLYQKIILIFSFTTYIEMKSTILQM